MSLRASQAAGTSQLIHKLKAARTLEEAGEYEQARAALAPEWRGVGHRPAVEGLDKALKGELLLRAGTLTGWIGSGRQIEGAQEQAKDLITEALRVFRRAGESEKVAECRSELGLCYWRLGEYMEARDVLGEAIKSSEGDDLRAVAVIRLAMIDCSESKHAAAAERMMRIAEAVERSENSSVKGRFHVNLASFLLAHGTETGDEGLTDRALLEFAGARIYFEEIGHKSFLAAIDNQLGYLFFKKRRFAEAHDHLARARAHYARLGDGANRAQVDETQARAYLEEGRGDLAEQKAGAAVKELKKGDALGALAEALITLGTAQARNGRPHLAQVSYARAREVAEGTGALEAAARACITALEELEGRLLREEAAGFYEGADALVSPAEQPELFGRLREAARRLIRGGAPATVRGGGDGAVIRLPGESPEWKGFNLKDEVKRYERLWIVAALKAGDGVPTRAAKLLGFRNHESLIGRIRSKHPDLEAERTAVVPRRARRSNGARLEGTKAG